MTNYHWDYDILREEFDGAGCFTYRESKNNQDPLEINTLRWYYASDKGVSSLCTLAETSQIVDTNHETYQLFDADWNVISEYTSYTIFDFDRYGNRTELRIQTDAYFQRNRNGYLQMVILEWYGGYEVIRVDASGKPLWSANYSQEDRALLNYTIWNYE